MATRLRDLIRALMALGVEVVPPSSGSHWKAKKAGSRTFPLPAHNGERTEMDDHYLRSMCRCLGIDLAELKKLL